MTTIELMLTIITIISLVFGMIMTYMNFRKSEQNDVRTEAADRAADNTSMMIKLEMINNNLIEFKSELTSLKDESRDNHDRIIRLESQCPHCKFNDIVTHVTELP